MSKIFLVVTILVNPIVLYVYGISWYLAILIYSAIVLASVLVQKYLPRVKIFGFNILLFLSLFLHGELVFTKGFPELIYTNLYDQYPTFYWNKPNLKEEIEGPEYKSFYYTNSQGLRIPDFQNPKSKIEQCDWLFIGDSYTQGAQCNMEELYTSRLFQHFPDKIIVNAGVSGFGVPQSYHLLEYLGPRLKPRKVFLQIGSFNDFMFVEESKATFLNYAMQYSNLLRYLVYTIKYPERDVLPLGRWTEPFRPNNKENKLYNIFHVNPSPYQKEQNQRLKAYVSKMDSMASEIGADLSIILFPSKEQISTRHYQEVISFYGLPTDSFDLYRPNKFLEKFLDSLNIPFYDVTDKLKESDELPFFEVDEHFNLLGHQLSADAIAEKMKKRDKLFHESEVLTQLDDPSRYPQIDAQQNMWFTSIKESYSNIFYCNDSVEHRFSVNQTRNETHPYLSVESNFLTFTVGNDYDYTTRVYFGSKENRLLAKCITEGNFYGAIPSINNKGSKILFAGWRFSSKFHDKTGTKLFLYDIEQGKIIDSIGSGSDNIWRPIFLEGSNIAYIKNTTDQYDIYCFNLETRIEKQLTYTKADEWDPIYDSHDSSIVFARKSDSWDLFRSIDGKESQLTFGKGDEWDPFVTKDGKLYYASKTGFFEVIHKYMK